MKRNLLVLFFFVVVVIIVSARKREPTRELKPVRKFDLVSFTSSFGEKSTDILIEAIVPEGVSEQLLLYRKYDDSRRSLFLDTLTACSTASSFRYYKFSDKFRGTSAGSIDCPFGYWVKNVGGVKTWQGDKQYALSERARRIQGYYAEFNCDYETAVKIDKSPRLKRLLKKGFSESDIALITQNKIWIGMTWEMLEESWGRPGSINSTVGVYGRHEQLVYDDRDAYVYLENGIVTTYQLSR